MIRPLTRLAALVAAGLGLALLAGGGPPLGAQRPPRAGQPAPEIAGAPWIGSPPLTLAALRGRVVLVEFWTYG